MPTTALSIPTTLRGLLYNAVLQTLNDKKLSNLCEETCEGFFIFRLKAEKPSLRHFRFSPVHQEQSFIHDHGSPIIKTTRRSDPAWEMVVVIDSLSPLGGALCNGIHCRARSGRCCYWNLGVSRFFGDQEAPVGRFQHTFSKQYHCITHSERVERSWVKIERRWVIAPIICQWRLTFAASSKVWHSSSRTK